MSRSKAATSISNFIGNYYRIIIIHLAYIVDDLVPL